MHEVFVAICMHVVTAEQTDDWRWRREQKTKTQRTVAFGGSLDAWMTCRGGDRYTHIATLAMDVISSQPFSYPTDTAVVAVVDLLPDVIVPKLALRAIVVGSFQSALYTNIPCRLRSRTLHAKHILGLLSVEEMLEW